MAVNRVSQTLPPSSEAPGAAVPRGSVRIKSGPGLAEKPQLRGGIQKGDLQRFDPLVAPFVTVTPARLQKIIPHDKGKPESERLLQHDQRTGRILLKLDSQEKILAMHNKVVRNQDVLDRFVKKEGIFKRIGECVAGFFRNIGSAVGLTQNEVAAHVSANVVTDNDGRTKLLVQTHKTEKLTGNPEGEGSLRLRHKQGIFAAMFRSLWAGSASPLKGIAWIHYKVWSGSNFEAKWSKWKYDHTNDGVYQKRLDQMRSSAQAMALKMAYLPTANVDEIDQVFDDLLEIDAAFQKETNFLGAIKEHIEKPLNQYATAAGHQAVAEAEKCLDAGLPLSHLKNTEHEVILRQIFKEIFVQEADADKALKDKQPFEQTDGAVYELGKEYRQAYQELKDVGAKMDQVGQQVEASKAQGNFVAGQVALKAAPVQAQLLKVRDQKAERALKLAQEVVDKDGAYARMRQGKALVRGMLPVAMKHDAAALRQFVQNELDNAGFSNQFTRNVWDVTGSYQFSKDAAQAVYEGIIKGVSEPLVKSLAMNEADALKADAKKFVDTFEGDVVARQDAVWSQGGRQIAAGLIGAEGVFRSGDNAQAQQDAEKAKHDGIGAFIIAKRAELQQRSGENELSLSRDVTTALTRQLDQLDAENKAVARSSNHVFEVLKPTGRLQQAVASTEQAMLEMVKVRPTLRGYDLSEKKLAALEEGLQKNLEALRGDLRKIQGELTTGHAGVLDHAVQKAEGRMRAAIADLRALRDAAAAAATTTDVTELRLARAAMNRLAARMAGPDADGNALSRDGVLPSESADAPFKASVSQLAGRIAAVLREAGQWSEAYDRRRDEIAIAVNNAPDRPMPSSGAGVYQRIEDVRRAKEAVLQAESERDRAVGDCAPLSGVNLRRLGAQYRIGVSQEAAQAQQDIIARSLGLSRGVAPPPSTDALEFWAGRSDESALAALHDYLHRDPALSTAQRNALFNALCGKLRPGQDNDVSDVARIADALFSGAGSLHQALALSRECLTSAGRTALDRRIRLAALDPVLDQVRANRGMQFMLKRLVPDADLGSGEGLLAALAKAERAAATDSSVGNVFAVHKAFDRLGEAYRLLKTPPGPGETHSFEDEERFGQLQRAAETFADMPENVEAMTRRQARLALADLLANVSGDPRAIESLRDVTATAVKEKVKAAVSLEGLARDPGYEGIGKQMAAVVKRMNVYAKAANAADVDSQKPLRALRAMMSPKDFEAFQTRVKNDPQYAESVLYYGVLMTYVDSIDSSDIGGTQHLKVGANPLDNPLLYLSPMRYSLKRPLDFSAFRQRAWSPEQVAAARAQLQQVASYLAGDQAPVTPEVRQMLAERMTFAVTIGESERQRIATKILSGGKLTPGEKTIVRDVSNIDQLDQALLHASRERVSRFEDDMAQAAALAPDYRYFDPRTLTFNETAMRNHAELVGDNPFRYGVMQQLTGKKEARIDELKQKLKLDDAGLAALQKRADESAWNIISRLGRVTLPDGVTTATEHGLQLFQAMQNVKMADVYTRARKDDAGQFAELAVARDRYLERTHALARQQMLRAGILMAWEETGQSFAAFADDPKSVRVVTNLLETWGFRELETSTSESSIVGERIRQELQAAKADVGTTTVRWAAEAGEFRSQLRACQIEFETAVEDILTRLSAAQAERSAVLADAGERARDAVFAMRAQTARAIDAAQLKPDGTVLVQAREIVSLRLDALSQQARRDGNGAAAGAIEALKGQIASRVVYRDGDTWDAVSDRAASCLRDGMTLLERRSAQPAAEAGMPVAIERLGVTGAVLQAVQDALEAEPELEAQALYNSAAIQFEADFRRDLPALRQQAALLRAEPEGEPIRLLGSRATDDLPELFRQGAPWMNGTDLASQGLPEATLIAIGRLQDIAGNENFTATVRADARALISVLLPLKRVADIVRALEGTPVSESNRPAIATLKRQLADALGELKQAAESKAVAAIKERKGSLFGSLAAERATIESIRANLTAPRSGAAAPVLQFHERIATAAAGIDRPSVDEGFDGEIAMDDGDPGAGVVAEAVRNEVLGFEAYVQDVARVFPEHAATCETLLQDAGGGMALYQIRSALYSALLKQDERGREAVQTTLNRLAERYAAAPATRAPGVAELGLTVERRLTDGEAIAAGAPRGATVDSPRLLDGNAYFQAIAGQTSEDQAGVRRRILGEMEKVAAGTASLPEGIASRPTAEQRAALSLDGRLHGAAAWGDDFHAPYVARVFKRPVVLVGADRALLFEADRPVKALAADARLPDNAIHLVHEGGNRWFAATKAPVKAAPQAAAQAAGATKPQAPVQQPVAAAQPRPPAVADNMPRTQFTNHGNTCYLNATLKTLLSSMGPSFVNELRAQEGRPPFDMTVGKSKPLDDIRQTLIALAGAAGDPRQQVAVDRRLKRLVDQINNSALKALATRADADRAALSKRLNATNDPLARARNDLELAQVASRLLGEGRSPATVLASLSEEAGAAKNCTTVEQFEAFIAQQTTVVRQREVVHEANRAQLNQEARAAGYGAVDEQLRVLTTASNAGKFVGTLKVQQDATEFATWLRDTMNLAPVHERFTSRRQFVNVWNEERRGPDEQNWSLRLNPRDPADSLQTLMSRALESEDSKSSANGGGGTQSLVIEADLGALTRFAISLDGRNDAGERVRLKAVDFDGEVTLPMVDARDGISKQVVLRPREVIFHEGDDRGGHYYAYVRGGGGWFRHDDAKPVSRENLPGLDKAQPRTITFEVVGVREAPVQPVNVPPQPSAVAPKSPPVANTASPAGGDSITPDQLLTYAGQRFDRALDYVKANKPADALSRANDAAQNFERVIGSAEATAEQKAAARRQLSEHTAQFLTAFNKKFSGAKLGGLESLEAMRRRRTARTALTGATPEKGGAPDKALLDRVRALKDATPVKALAGKAAVVATDDYVAVLELELAIANQYLKLADERLEEELAHDAKLRTDKKNAELQKAKKLAGAQRELQQAQARDRLKSAREYFDALNKSAWVVDASQPLLKSYGEKLKTLETAAKK